MKKLLILCILSSFVMSISFCKKEIIAPIEEIPDPEIPTPDDGGFNVPPEDLVALTAVFNEKDETGMYLEKLVLLDYNNPSNYMIVTDTTYQVIRPKFSPDKSKILFGDEFRIYHDVGPPQCIYYHQDRVIQRLLLHPNSSLPFFALERIWNLDNDSFYFSDLPVFWYASIYFFRISPHSVETVLESEFKLEYSVYPIALISPDTLMILKEFTYQENENPEFYLLNLLDKSLFKINNPYLFNTNNKGYKLNAYALDWNNELRLFVYGERFQKVKGGIGHKISVTNLNGNYYRNYTLGASDSFPVWGPEGKTILFQKGFNGLASKIMIIDVQTGDIREFVHPTVINGAAGLRFPDY